MPRENTAMPRAIALAAAGNLGAAQRKALATVAATDLCDFPRRNLNQLWFEYAGASREPLLRDDRHYYRSRLRDGIRQYRRLVARGYRPKVAVVTEVRRAA